MTNRIKSILNTCKKIFIIVLISAQFSNDSIAILQNNVVGPNSIQIDKSNASGGFLIENSQQGAAAVEGGLILYDADNNKFRSIVNKNGVLKINIDGLGTLKRILNEDDLGIAASNGSVNNITINNGYLQSTTLNGDTTIDGVLTFAPGSTISGNVYSSGTINAVQFNGDVFNGGIFRGTFIGDGSQLTGIAASNGSVNHLTTNSSTINNSTIHNSVINGSNTVVDGKIIFTDNGYLQDPTINGTALFKNNSIAKFNGGILIPGSAGANKVLSSDAFGNATWQALSSLPATNATTLDTLDSLQFLRSDATDNFSSGVLITDSGTRFDVNGDLSIADTDIFLDGASTTFTQTTGAITMYPANGSNMNVRLDGISDFIIDINKFIINNNGNVGISITNPQATLDINGSLAIKSSSITNIIAGNGISPTKSIMKIQGNAGAVDISVDPQITDGTDGQILVLKGVSDTNTVKLDNGTGISLTDSLSFTLGNKDTITFIYDATDDEWIEISRSDK